MTNIKYINPGTPLAGPYSPGIIAGNILFISGQGPKRGTISIEDQTYSTLEKIKIIIEATGGKVKNIVNTTLFLRNIKEFGKMNETYKKFFNDNGVVENYPTRTTVEVSNLPLASMLIEINAIVVL